VLKSFSKKVGGSWVPVLEKKRGRNGFEAALWEKPPE